MGFLNLHIKSYYDSGEDDILNEFYIPVLKESVEYRRLAGFFSSTSLAVAARGIRGLLENDGKMKLVAGAIFSKEDIEAIKEGIERPEDVIKRVAIKDFDSIENELIRNHVCALGWMVANNRLEIRVAIVRDENGIPLDVQSILERGLFHQKVGILIDNEDYMISFSGSINETAKAWLENIEEIKVFRSWIEAEYVYFKSDYEKFERYWNGKTTRIEILEVPEAVKKRLIQMAPSNIETLNLDWRPKNKKDKKIKLRDYQLQAIENWVNLIGRGYPSPNRWFRWCTDRLKIKPMTKYILEQVKENGEVIILLGIRKSESNVRAQTMDKYEIEDFKLRKHAKIPGAYIYAPIEDWEEDEVWNYLLKVPSPWGDDNRNLIRFYRKGDTEIQFIIDESAPPSGSSRFGCWVCTVVERDRALEGSIEEGETWLKPLLEFRNWLKKIRDNPKYRESIRKSDRKKKLIADTLGREFTPSEHRGHKVLGPFTFETRHKILRRLLNLQEMVAGKGISLISPEEIKAIETIWIYEGDNISSIADIFEASSEGINQNKILMSNDEWFKKIEEICNRHGISAQLIKKLLIVEKDFSLLSRRAGIYERLEKVIEEHMMGDIIIESKEN